MREHLQGTLVVDVGYPVAVTAPDGAIDGFSLIRESTRPIRPAHSHIATPDFHVKHHDKAGVADVQLRRLIDHCGYESLLRG